MVRNTEKREKGEIHTVGPGLWQENSKTWKMTRQICMTWNMARKVKNVENETQTLFDMEYGKKHSKTWKIRNAQCRTLKMTRKLKILENEKRTL